MSRLAILGASGHGKIVADAALASNDWTDIVFFDDNYPDVNSIEQWAVIGNTDELIKNQDSFTGVFVAIGSNETRVLKQHLLQKAGCPIITIIHPSATVSQFASISCGTLVMAGAIINAFATIGEACIINSNAVIEHDCKLDEGVHICPGALLAGEVDVGYCSFVGIGSCVRQGITIGSKITLGAGTVVIKDLTAAGLYIGNPARSL